MENTNKKYWKGVEELKNDIGFVQNANREFNLDDIETELIEPDTAALFDSSNKLKLKELT
jgi:MoCo/4Fe-4S cofactor protein with predicted Tat translocation signal